MKKKNEHGFDAIGSAIGKGLLAGLAGTAAVTLSQAIDNKLSGYQPAADPVKAADKVLDIQPKNEEKKEKVMQEMHWTYGTSWGLARGLLGVLGLKGWPATLAHFAAISGTATFLLPELEVATPAKEQDATQLTKGTLHHVVYAVAAGLVYDALDGQ